MPILSAAAATPWSSTSKAASSAKPSKAREIFDHFDVDGSGCLTFDEVLHGLRAYGLQAAAADVRALFDAADKDGSGRISGMAEFEHLVASVAHLRQGRAADGARLLQAASALHAQALSEPLVLVAEGEVPMLLKCAVSGHAAVGLLGLSALAAVAEAPQADCAAAIVSRTDALAQVLSRLNVAGCAPAQVRQGARLLSALCREAGEAREVTTRRQLRLRLYDLAVPLLRGPFADAVVACADADVLTAQAAAHALQAFASEPSLTRRLACDGVRLVCTLATATSDAHARTALVETMAAMAEGSDEGWRLIGHGALPLLVLASAAGEGEAEAAARALKALHYEELWRGTAAPAR